jgi:predicted nuclease of restriction endonuclease-like (RecB) superfamily
VSNIITTEKYEQLLDTISSVYEAGRVRAVNAVNAELVRTYWIIGQHIVEFEQAGMQRADYGKGLLEQLSKDLTLQHGRGFSRSNLIRFRQFYLVYPICATVSHELSWSHIVELLKIDNALEREFYEKQTVSENWSVRELQRQKESGLFLRLSMGKNKQEILDLSKNGQIIEKPTDILKDPYIFEFLKIPEPYHIAETQLESLLCDNLQSFLLELGKGFTFVGRQYRVTLNNTHYKVDLVFYHRILRCFVLIDLKINEVKHHDIGQMNMYLGYFANEQNIEGDNPPIGIILSKDKDELLVEYATYGMNSQLFVQKYQLYLPNQDELRKEIEDVLKGEELPLIDA